MLQNGRYTRNENIHQAGVTCEKCSFCKKTFNALTMRKFGKSVKPFFSHRKWSNKVKIVQRRPKRQDEASYK